MALPIRWMTAFTDLPAADPDAAAAFWLRVLGGALSPWRGDHAQFATILTVTGDPYLRLQKSAEGAGGVHLDLHVPPAALSSSANDAVALGASVITTDDDLVVLRSPGGFPFCLSIEDGESVVPAPVIGSAGGFRADQLALDVPPTLYEQETAFWAALTGRPVTPNDSPEFLSLAAPPGEPLRLLLHRLNDGTPPVTGHLDLACADRDALAAEHEALGATVVERFAGWTTMRAPTGRPYCLTGRAPV